MLIGCFFDLQQELDEFYGNHTGSDKKHDTEKWFKTLEPGLIIGLSGKGRERRKMESKKNKLKIKITKDGPYIVSGGVPMYKETIVADERGRSDHWERGKQYPHQETYALCRCGHSKNPPYCDGSHGRIGFHGQETASRADYLTQIDAIDGPGVILTDVTKLCAYARFCHRKEGDIWDLAEQSDDPELRESVIKGTWECPAGRLVAWDKETRQSIDEKVEPSIGIVEDPRQGVSGPIWVRGGISLESSDGFEYEVRNQMTLCRCGKSRNKPFCDGTHAGIGYKADEKE